LVKQLSFKTSGELKQAVIGNGRFVIGDDLEALLGSANINYESLAEKGLSSLRRKNNDGIIWFINNRTAAPFSDWIELKDKAVAVALFDPMTGKNGLARWRTNAKGVIEVFLHLESFESLIIQSFHSRKVGPLFPYADAADQPQTLNGNWDIDFLEGGPSIPARQSGIPLQPWTSISGKEDLNNFSGLAKYSTTFNKPQVNSKAWLLDLGKVNETAEVLLNGKKIATLIGPVFRVVIPSNVLQQTNKLEVIVANLMANRIAYMDRSNMSWKIFYNTNMPARKSENLKNGLFDAGAWKPLVSGLSGPVTLTPLK
jgi:hypothetical protein